jgi:peroxiredoxin family protein
MSAKLGILVTSDKFFAYALNLTHAACATGREVHIFFTGTGVRMTQLPGFQELAEKATLSVCDASFQAAGLSEAVPGLSANYFTSQAKNAEIINLCDRFLVL